MPFTPSIAIRGARQNNLKNVSLTIPAYQLIVVTGLSGSGKSSLAFDVLASEGMRRYMETIPSFARQFAGKVKAAEVEEIEGLFPVVRVGQSKSRPSVKATVGTLSDIYDHFRLLFARFGEGPKEQQLSRSLFSFNHALGACPTCNGIGQEEFISKEKLISDPTKSLREGALVPSLPNGYIMYSQLTIDALDKVCRAHDFHVDIPWNELSLEQQEVIWNGSTRVKVPFGKHSIESRLKWTGIKAKPREEGFYKGMIPVMSDILKRDRNKNILRFVSATTCSDCKGRRLNDAALSVHYHGKNIHQYAEMSFDSLWDEMQSWSHKNTAEEDIHAILCQYVKNALRLGLGQYAMTDPATSLAAGALQRLRMIHQIQAEMSDVLYVFDEPASGLHPSGRMELGAIFRELVDAGNTVCLVAHDPEIIRMADWIVEMGPGAGIHGGTVTFNGPASQFFRFDQKELSPTQEVLKANYVINRKAKSLGTTGVVPEALTVICGASEQKNHAALAKLLKDDLPWQFVDRKPIGRTPRSNPASYIGLADHIRDCFASTPAAKEVGFKKSHFSFNNKGGRCETCEGAGKLQLGMQYMGQVDIVCSSCLGKRFHEDVLQVKFQGKSIAEVYELSVAEALVFFEGHSKIMRYLDMLSEMGLSYLSLGQSSTSLSGGEAQRIKLVAGLLKSSKNKHFILEEAGTGLHMKDLQQLIQLFQKLCMEGHTIVCMEHQAQFILAADHIIEPGIFSGTPEAFLASNSPTAKAIQHKVVVEPSQGHNQSTSIELGGVHTNSLKDIDVQIPKGKITMVAGLSGSGKSSLVYDTIYAEAFHRFVSNLSPYARTYIKQSNPASAFSYSGLSPVMAIGRKDVVKNDRSTVGTLSGLYEKYRYLFSRIAALEGKEIPASAFSFTNESGACEHCGGLSYEWQPSDDMLLKDASLSVLEGAFCWNKSMAYYGNPDGEFIAILKEVAKNHNIRLDLALVDLSAEEREVILAGTGETAWTTVWQFKNKTRKGEKTITAPWKGMRAYIQEEFEKKRYHNNREEVLVLMEKVTCPVCEGKRLKKERLQYHYGGKNIADFLAMSAQETLVFLKEVTEVPEKSMLAKLALKGVETMLERMCLLGLGHLQFDRSAASLSGGEGQRLRLVSVFHSQLRGLCYVLDEPSVGLHPKDWPALLDLLKRLCKAGNTVIAVEHERFFLSAADHLIEMGPGAGNEGGTIVYEGTVAAINSSSSSLLARYLNQNAVPEKTTVALAENAIQIKGIQRYDVFVQELSFATGGIVALTGASGVGKSTVMHEVLWPSLNYGKPIHCDSFQTTTQFDKVIRVDQKQLKFSQQQTLVGFTGVLDLLQTIMVKQAKKLGEKRKKSSFSFLHKDGRCEHCKGEGKEVVKLDFMADVWNPCDVCNGSRYQVHVRNIHWKHYDIASLLNVTLHQLEQLIGTPEDIQEKKMLSIVKQCKSLSLGHLQLGQRLSELSTGELQRLQLLDQVGEIREGASYLFLLDEPSSGLHYKDQDALIQWFHQLNALGHTVLFIEHNPYMIAAAHQEISLS